MYGAIELFAVLPLLTDVRSDGGCRAKRWD